MRLQITLEKTETMYVFIEAPDNFDTRFLYNYKDKIIDATRKIDYWKDKEVSIANCSTKISHEYENTIDFELEDVLDDHFKIPNISNDMFGEII